MCKEHQQQNACTQQTNKRCGHAVKQREQQHIHLNGVYGYGTSMYSIPVTDRDQSFR